MEPVGISLFCDDIRFEQGNKVTFVGCYGPDMIVNGKLPYVLPRLGVFVQLRLPAGSTHPSKILVYFPDSRADEPKFVFDIPAPSADNVKRSEQPRDSDVVSLLATNVPMLLGPIALNAEGLIKIRVKWGEKIIKAGTLKIVVVDNGAATTDAG